jgi:nicotinamide mononucleotide (NMN) deamidase PncC
VTGVAGPEEQEGQPAGTVFFGLAVGDGPVEAAGTQLPGQREMVELIRVMRSFEANQKS